MKWLVVVVVVVCAAAHDAVMYDTLIVSCLATSWDLLRRAVWEVVGRGGRVEAAVLVGLVAALIRMAAAAALMAK